MNVKMFFSDGIESVDSLAVGGVDATMASITVRGDQLVLNSTLFKKVGGDDDARLDFSERPGVALLALREPGASGLYEFLEDAGDQCGLLRFDVDGETIWQKEDGYGE